MITYLDQQIYAHYSYSVSNSGNLQTKVAIEMLYLGKSDPKKPKAPVGITPQETLITKPICSRRAHS